MKELRKTNPDVEKHIFAAIHMVNMDTLLGWKQDGEEHSFLEAYDNQKDGPEGPSEDV